MAGHAVALEDVVRIGVHTDRADVAMHLFDAVTGALAGKMMPLHRARGAAALGDASHIDGLDLGKLIDAKLLPHLNPSISQPWPHAEFAHETLRLAIGLGDRLDAGRRTALLTLAIEPGDVAAIAAAGKTTGLIK